MALDESLFAEHMRGSNLLEMVLKGHLWVESCLNRALELSLAVPDRLEIDRLPYAAKLNLCLATGALCSEDAQALRRLNSIRNRVAHDLHSVVGDADVTALERAMSARLSGVYATVRADGEPTQRLRTWLYTVLMVLEYQNMIIEYEKVNRRVLQAYRLVSALDERLAETDGREVKPKEDLREQHNVPPEPNPRDAWTNLSEDFGTV